jgi:branched-chain amino acid transport system substrate-binding protein
MKTPYIVLIVIIVLALIIIGFTMFNNTTGNVVKDHETHVKIGVIIPLTGVSANAGNYVKQGVTLASKDIDSNIKYDLIYEDSVYSPQNGVNSMNKLIEVDDIHYIISYGSSITLALAPIAEKNKILLIDPGSQSDKISEAGDYIFRTQTSVFDEAKFFSQFLIKQINNSKLNIIAINTDLGESVINDYTNEITKKGGKIGIVEKFDSNEDDFRTVLTKIKSDKIEYILTAGNSEQTAAILKQADEMRLKAKFFAVSAGIERSEFLDLAKGLGEGIVYPYPYDSTSELKSIVEYKIKYDKEYKKDNEMVSANSYDVLIILNSCIKKVGDDSTKVKDCLYTIKNYNGASGIISFDSNGNVVKPFILKTIKNGEFVVYNEGSE